MQRFFSSMRGYLLLKKGQLKKLELLHSKKRSSMSSAQSNAQEIRGRLFQFFVVQSNSHQPEELLYRFELFLEEFVSDLKTNLDLQRFELVRNGCITSIKNRISNLKDRCAFWDLLADR